MGLVTTKLIDFLMEFKSIVTDGRGLDIIPRPKNNQTILELELTKENIKETILDLTTIDYVRGPEIDRDKPGEVWVFGREIAQQEVYIKLKITQVGLEKIAKCISFHIAEFPLRYPNKRR
jgi:hypothetical protein